jgi:hypothetical protein
MFICLLASDVGPLASDVCPCAFASDVGPCMCSLASKVELLRASVSTWLHVTPFGALADMQLPAVS